MTRTRRMLIEDIELMIEARRRLLAHEARLSEQGERPDDALSAAARLLRDDDRLEQPIFVEMEVDAEFDGAMDAALAFEAAQLPKDPPPLQVETADVPLWLKARLEHVERVRERLRS